MVQTAATMTELPKDSRPEEFLTDADLVGFYQRQAKALDADDPMRAVLNAKARRASVAAALTTEAIGAAEAEAAVELAKSRKTK